MVGFFTFGVTVVRLELELFIRLARDGMGGLETLLVEGLDNCVEFIVPPNLLATLETLPVETGAIRGEVMDVEVGSCGLSNSTRSHPSFLAWTRIRSPLLRVI